MRNLHIIQNSHGILFGEEDEKILRKNGVMRWVRFGIRILELTRLEGRRLHIYVEEKCRPGWFFFFPSFFEGR